jgi:phosphoserine phosphatase RsbU/P
VLYSDGVADARSDSGEEFGDERLLELLVHARTQPAAAIIERVFDAIDRFAAKAPQFDDITILVLRRGTV